MRPPRTLWVPFSLGRPFGVPNDADFQTGVLSMALELLERPDGPVVLEDFPSDAPVTVISEPQEMFCPVAFKTSVPADSSELYAAVKSEMQALTPWYVKSLERQNGRTTVGLSGLDIAEALQWIENLRTEKPVQVVGSLTLGQTLRFVAEDLRSWYSEAAIARPAANPDPVEMANWFWGETAMGRLLLYLQPIAASHGDDEVRLIGERSLVPRSQMFRVG